MKLRKTHGRNHHEVTIPPWVVDHLQAENGTRLKPSIWRAGDRIRLDSDAVLFEVVED